MILKKLDHLIEEWSKKTILAHFWTLSVLTVIVHLRASVQSKICFISKTRLPIFLQFN
jgi:hypothetical protein